MIYLILLLSLSLRLFGLNQSLWLDEAAQAFESARPLSQQLQIQADFWPPLYHILLHFWMMGGKSEVWLRLLSVGISVVSVYLLYKLVKHWLSEKTALLTTLFLALSPFHIWYSQEVRPYTLTIFWALLTTIFLLRRQYLLYVFAAVGFLYTTYLAPFMLVSQGVYLLFWDKDYLRKWLLSLTVAALAFFPWLPSLLDQLQGGMRLATILPGWGDAVSTPLIKSLPLVFTKFIIGRITFTNKLFYGIFVIALFLLFVKLVIEFFKKKTKVTLKIGLLLTLPMMLAFIVSLKLPILAPQRVLFVLPFFYILLAGGIVSLIHRKKLLLVILIGVELFSLYLYATNPQFQREQWRQAVAWVEENRTAESKAVFVFPAAFAPWQWYSNGVVEAVAVAPTFKISEVDLMPFQVKLAASDRLFYFHYLADLTDSDKKMPGFFTNLGFLEKRKMDFPGVGFISVYDKALVRR